MSITINCHPDAKDRAEAIDHETFATVGLHGVHIFFRDIASANNVAEAINAHQEKWRAAIEEELGKENAA